MTWKRSGMLPAMPAAIACADIAACGSTRRSRMDAAASNARRSSAPAGGRRRSPIRASRSAQPVQPRATASRVRQTDRETVSTWGRSAACRSRAQRVADSSARNIGDSQRGNTSIASAGIEGRNFGTHAAGASPFVLSMYAPAAGAGCMIGDGRRRRQGNFAATMNITAKMAFFLDNLSTRTDHGDRTTNRFGIGGRLHHDGDSEFT